MSCIIINFLLHLSLETKNSMIKMLGGPNSNVGGFMKINIEIQLELHFFLCRHLCRVHALSQPVIFSRSRFIRLKTRNWSCL